MFLIANCGPAGDKWLSKNLFLVIYDLRLSIVKRVFDCRLPDVDMDIENLTWGAHVLLNLLNEFRKRDKMRGLPSILSLFPNKFNKLNNTGAQMLDSIYHMTLSLKDICY